MIDDLLCCTALGNQLQIENHFLCLHPLNNCAIKNYPHELFLGLYRLPADEAQYARYHWEPEAGIAGQILEELEKQQPSYLFEELEARLRKAQAVFNLDLQPAKEWDPTDDPTTY
jgi:hypothetical protein